MPRFLTEFSRRPWPALFAVSGAATLLAIPFEPHAPFAALCGGGWSVEALNLALATAPFATLAAGWLLMLAVMMPPLLAQPLDHVSASSRPAGRPRAVIGFVFGYGLSWMAAGLVLVAAAMLLALVAGDLAATAAVVLALAWNASPWHRQVLNRGHRLRRLSVFGWRGDRDTIVYGLVHGGWCIAACWAWMLVPLVLSHHHLAMMLAVGAILLADRVTPPGAPRWHWPAGLILLYLALDRLRGRSQQRVSHA